MNRVSQGWLARLSATTLDRSVFHVRFDRSGGKGGQNVNKVNTKATIRLDRESLRTTASVPEGVKDRILNGRPLAPAVAGDPANWSHSKTNDLKHIQASKFRYLTASGDIVVQCDSYRSQPQNLEACYDKLVDEIKRCCQSRDDDDDALKDAKWRKIKQRTLAATKKDKLRRADVKGGRGKITM